MTSLRPTPPVLLLALTLWLVAACSGPSPSADPSADPSAHPSPGRSATASRSASAAPTPTATPVAVPPAPRPGACYRLSPDQLTIASNASPPVPCSARHTARTVYVGRLSTVRDGHSLAVDSAAVQRQLASVCPRRLASYLGGSATTLHLSRFHVVWFSPTAQQSDEGASWFRCDAIAFSGTSSLADLPRHGTLRGVLTRPGALGTWGLCGTAAPGAPGFRRVVCGRAHSWVAIDTIAIAGSTAYPGTATVRAAGDALCKGRAKARSGSLKFTYGWEWPTAEQWRAGQHYGYCWVPSAA